MSDKTNPYESPAAEQTEERALRYEAFQPQQAEWVFTLVNVLHLLLGTLQLLFGIGLLITSLELSPIPLLRSALAVGIACLLMATLAFVSAILLHLRRWSGWGLSILSAIVVGCLGLACLCVCFPLSFIYVPYAVIVGIITLRMAPGEFR